MNFEEKAKETMTLMVAKGRKSSFEDVLVIISQALKEAYEQGLKSCKCESCEQVRQAINRLRKYNDV